MPGRCLGPLAQSVEQKTFNLLVDGSNPSRPTIKNYGYASLRPGLAPCCFRWSLLGAYMPRASFSIVFRDDDLRKTAADCHRRGARRAVPLIQAGQMRGNGAYVRSAVPCLLSEALVGAPMEEA